MSRSGKFSKSIFLFGDPKQKFIFVKKKIDRVKICHQFRLVSDRLSPYAA